MADFESLVSIVTGATSGIGKATAKLLAQKGSKVVVAGRREAEGQAVVDDIKANGGEAVFVKTDVTSESDVQNLVARTLETYGRVDVAFLNSGVFRFNAIGKQLADDLAEQIDVNIKGVYYGLKHVANAMGDKGGSIVFNSSTVDAVGFPGASAYSLTKGAVNTLTRTAAVELADKGIRVNSVAPGPIWTEGAGDLFGDRETAETNFKTNIPLGRIGEPNEIAEVVAFLAGPASSFVTGQVIYADGGLGIK
ncbi:MAG: SDR family oxidoreductase [Armatimonadetes bacterium]|nr:SDR family oxidoreductase [Armatimonadota bacterium]